MKRLLLFLLCFPIPSNAAMPDLITEQQAINIVRQFAGDPSLPLESLGLNADEDGSGGPLAQNLWILESPSGIWSVASNQGIVYRYSAYGPKQPRATAAITRTVAQQYLTAKVARFSQGYYAEDTPGFYHRITARGFKDYTNDCGVTVNADGTIASYWYEEASSPDFANANIINLAQASSVAGAYVLNGLSDAPSVVCEPIVTTANIQYSPAGNYFVGYNFYVSEVMDNGCGISYAVAVDAETSAAFHTVMSGEGAQKGQIYNRRSKLPATSRVLLNGSSVGGSFIYKSMIIVDIRFVNLMMQGHKLTAKAGEKAFTMDGKRIALPAKVVAKAGTLYLPWQALKSLPGVKCSYDAKLNKLDITTKPAVKKAQ